MKYYLILIIGCLLSVNSKAQDEKKMYVFAGSIAGKYSIQMTLTITGNEVLGHYYYDSYGTLIPLTGIVDGSKITLSESCEAGTNFSIGFVGYLNNQEFKGDWMDLNKRKKYTFSLGLSGETTVTPSKLQAKREGSYQNKGLDKYDFASIKLRHIFGDVYLFELTTGTPEGCTGYVKNILIIDEDNRARYNGPNCYSIDFQFASKSIQIDEESCDLHGMDCYFAGKYSK